MKKILIPFITLLLLLPASWSASADDDHDEARRLLKSGDIVSLEVILQNASRIQQGKILEVELESEKGKWVYEIELLSPEGDVVELVFDAATGQHLYSKRED